ncbi:MAG: site-2 protease family protein [Euryarchaeota archaeon]|nr:site-2 protease family protein [Euryarchaeota archaeon]
MSYYIRVEPAPRRMRFSSREIFEILVAVVVLTIAFTLAQVGGLFRLQLYLQLGGGSFLLLLLGSSFVAVITAFVLHELAHKAVAQRYGCFAEFRFYLGGLALGVLTAMFGLMFAAPGAVVISGSVNARQHVRISAAGPGTNLAVAAGFIGVAFALGGVERGTDIAATFVGSIAFVNLFLGFFNLIPFPPLDGSKIFALDKVIWIGMVAVLAALFLVGASLGVF